VTRCTASTQSLCVYDIPVMRLWTYRVVDIHPVPMHNDRAAREGRNSPRNSPMKVVATKNGAGFRLATKNGAGFRLSTKSGAGFRLTTKSGAGFRLAA
jgi:hypothetical protein